MISIQGLQRSFGARTLFRDGTLRVGARDRVALVGPNGSGKTTLFEMIVGLQQPDGGSIDVVRGASLGYLPQETDALRGRSILQEVLSVATAAQDGHRLEVLATEIAETTDEDERARLLAEYARLQDRFEAAGGYSVEAQAREILAGLGFADADLDRRTETLSGGWLMRVALAKILVAAPDALLLDEPTNHLDLESVRWLERFLRGFEGAVLLISHDRDFMNGIATRVVEIENATLVAYTGDYEAFVRQRAQRMEQALAAAKHQQRAIAQTELFINRFRYKASKARQVQSRIKALEKMERVEVPGAQRRTMGIRFPTPPRSGRVVVELDRVAFAYGDTRVYTDLSVSIERGQKVALVGPNGAGKTTLLKLLAGVLEPQAGDRRLGHNVALGYFAQHQIEALDPRNRVIEELSAAMPAGATVKPRDLLGRFLFSGDDVDKTVSVLSGGERTRLALAKMLVSPFNVLCLDEPTNHLDIASRDALEDALEDYEGALVLITHDRHLIRATANRILHVANGTVGSYDGDYEYYLSKVEDEPAPQTTRRQEPSAAKQRRRDGAAERARVKALRDAVRRVERAIEQTQTEVDELATLMADPGFYTSDHDIGAVVRRYEDGRARLAALEAEWEQAATAFEEGASVHGS